MASLQNEYAKHINSGLEWGASWIPSMLVEIGDVGVFTDGVFIKVTDLADLGIDFESEPAAHEAELTFLSENGVSVDTKAAGETSTVFKAIGEASAGIAVKFGRKVGVAMSLAGLTGTRLRNRPALEEEIRRRLSGASDQGWQEDYAVVVELLQAQTGTILVSRDAGTQVELEAKGNIPGGAAALGSISGDVSLAYADAMSQMLVAKHGLTPLFHTLRLKTGFWSGEIQTVFRRSNDGDDAGAGTEGIEVPVEGAFDIVDYYDGGNQQPDD